MATISPLPSAAGQRRCPGRSRRPAGPGSPGASPNRPPHTKAVRPSTEPIDRSTFRLTTTIVSPSASSANTVVLISRNWMFCWFRNDGSMTVVTATKHHEHGDDAGLADPEHPLGELAGAARRGSARGVDSPGHGGGHEACSGSWPVAAAMIFSSVASSCRSSADQPALAHDQDRGRPMPQHLGQLGGDHQDRDPFRGQLGRAGGGPPPWCAMSMPAGRLVHDEHGRAAAQPLGQHDLLLVAAGQRGRPGRSAGRT